MHGGDTPTDALRVQTESFAAMTAEQRFEMTMQMSELVRELSRSGIRRQYPQWTDRQVSEELVRRLYGRQIAAAAFGR